MFKRVYDATRIDLYMPEVFLAKMALSPIVFAEVLPILLDSQLDAHGVKTAEDGLDLFNGKPYFDAQTAFLKAYADFFQAAGHCGRYERILSFLEAQNKMAVSSGMTDEETEKTNFNPDGDSLLSGLVKQVLTGAS